MYLLPPMANSIVADPPVTESIAAAPSMVETVMTNPPGVVDRPVKRGPDAAAAQPVGDNTSESEPTIVEIHTDETAVELPMQTEERQDSYFADIKENRDTDNEMKAPVFKVPSKRKKKPQSKGNKQVIKMKQMQKKIVMATPLTQAGHIVHRQMM